MNTKALILTVASLVLGTGALVVLVVAAIKGISLEGVEPFLWTLVGQLGMVLGIQVDGAKRRDS